MRDCKNIFKMRGSAFSSYSFLSYNLCYTTFMDIYTDDDMMDIVKKTHALAEENNEMLHAMRRNQRIAFFFRLVFWAIVIGLPLMLYYYLLAPYMAEMQATFKTIQGQVGQVESMQQSLPEKAKEFLSNFLKDPGAQTVPLE